MGYQHKEKVCDPVRTLRFSPSFCYFLKIAISHHRFYSHTYMTIVGLDFCPPLNAAERVSLYHWVSPLNHQLSHTRIDTAFFSWDIPTRALGIYKENTRGVGISQEKTRINPGMGQLMVEGGCPMVKCHPLCSI